MIVDREGPHALMMGACSQGGLAGGGARGHDAWCRRVFGALLLGANLGLLPYRIL